MQPQPRRLDIKQSTKSLSSAFGQVVFRCSLPKAMSISRSEILRKKEEEKKDQKMKKSWNVMGVQWEVIGGQRKVSGRSWEVNEGFWEVSGRSRGGHWRSLGG